MNQRQKPFAESVADDPEFVAYLKGHDLGVPVLSAVESYVTLLELRAQTLSRQADDQDHLADIMESHGFEDTGQLWDAVERGDVTLPDAAFEALVRIGAKY